ncbi:MAG: hypothetical protein COB69_00175 [Phycisphaera sp.]|nr:MAG: hypothetical protein COB69_00175 [Phycisphaera sp.]
MVIAAGDVYTYDGTTLTDTGITADSVTYLNSKSIYPATGQVFSVTGASGPATITSTGSAESAPDDLRRPFAFNQWAYMMGVETIEPFYDTGATSGVPLSRIDSAIMQKGLGGFYTVANTDQALYFLADDSNVYKIMQAQLINVTPPYIVNEIRGLNKTAATAFTMVFNGQDFYILRFASGPSFVYIEQIDEWVNLSTDVNNEPYLASSYAKAYDKDIVVDFRTSNTVELSPDTFDELGDVIQRQRVLAPFSSVDLGLGAGKRLIMSKISFSVQTGQGLVSGQGSEPQIMVEYSLDGGETFSEEQWIEFGKLGQFLIKVDYWKMVSFYEITFRITVSDPVFCSLHDASIDVKLDGF